MLSTERIEKVDCIETRPEIAAQANAIEPLNSTASVKLIRKQLCAKASKPFIDWGMKDSLNDESVTRNYSLKRALHILKRQLSILSSADYALLNFTSQKRAKMQNPHQ